MKNLDEATLEHIIEVITRQVLLLLQEEDETDTGSPVPISSRNFVEVVQPVVHAGADRIASTLGIAPADGSLPHLIDHTLLKPDATHDQIAQLCYEARKHGFASVCVNPTNVKLCAQLLKGSGVPVCTVVGFPLGATPTEVKVFETQQAIGDGATEVDMVVNVGALHCPRLSCGQRYPEGDH
jgi:deoxyribose-phosphate aldolase